MSFEPQNTIFILSDEHAREFTGCYGHSMVKTPNMDRMAERGTRFTNAYTNCPICVPARASLATGRYVHDLRLWDNAHPYTGEPSGWGQRLIDRGHHVTAIGKLHYRSEDDATGWSEEIDTLHVINGIGDVAGSVRTEMRERKTARYMADNAGRGMSSYARYDGSTAERAVRWLSEEAPRHQGRPWMLYLGFVLPHFPLVAPPEFFDMYPDPPPPRLYGPEERTTHPVLREMARVQAHDKFFDAEKLRTARQAYFGMVTYLDHCIGQVLDALEASSLADSTRVIYTTDHGDNLGNRGLWGKSNMHEESVALPMIMTGAGVPEGETVDTPVSLVDLYQTLLQSAGVELNDVERDELPGHSLLEIANGERPDRTILSEYHASSSPTGFFMIRNGDYKYVYYADGPPQLFNLADDPNEIADLAAEPAFASVLAECEAKLRSILDPDRVSRQAFDDQRALIERHGGLEQVLGGSDLGYTPVPGEAPQYG
ncbi:MAG: sulfatase-like hydrolase/transferase [Pseudomonadota bacterium]